jgi:glycosyltransferase involved in cell wall biosynthesis
MPKISACLIVRDEESNIQRCLDSIVEQVDEIIIVDTGSIDNTVELCKKYTDKIYFKKWNNNFSEARNYSIEKSTGDWVFLIDADEELFIKNIDKDLKFIVKKAEQNNCKVIIPINRNYMSFDYQTYDEFNLPRLFTKGNIKYVNSVHNQPIYNGKEFHTSDIKIYHYGYLWTESLKLKKLNRSYPLILNEIENFKEKNHDSQYYYIGQKLKLDLISENDYIFLRDFKKYKKEILEKSKEEAMSIENVKDYIYTIEKYGMVSEAKDITEVFYLNNKLNPDISLIMANFYYKENDYKNSIKYFEVFLNALYNYYNNISKISFSVIYNSILFKTLKMMFLCFSRENIELKFENISEEKLIYIYNNNDFNYMSELYFYFLLKDLNINVKKPLLLQENFKNEVLERNIGRYLIKIDKEKKDLIYFLILSYSLYFENLDYMYSNIFEVFNENLNGKNLAIVLIFAEELFNILGNNIFYKLTLKVLGENSDLWKYFEAVFYFKNKDKIKGMAFFNKNKSIHKKSMTEDIMYRYIKDIEITNYSLIKRPYILSVLDSNINLYENEKIFHSSICKIFENDNISQEFITFMNISDLNNINKSLVEDYLCLYEKNRDLNVMECLKNYIIKKIEDKSEKNLKSVIKDIEKILESFQNPYIPTPKWAISVLEDKNSKKSCFFDLKDKIIYLSIPAFNYNLDMEITFLNIWKEKRNFYYKEKILDKKDNSNIIKYFEEDINIINSYLDNYIDIEENMLLINFNKKYGIIGENDEFDFKLFDESAIFLPELLDEKNFKIFLEEDFFNSKLIITFSDPESAFKNPYSNFYLKDKIFLKNDYHIILNDGKYKYYIKK